MNDHGTLPRWVPLAGLMLALGTYVFLATRQIRCPGLGYDEVMWATVAIDRPDGGWIAWSVGRWPVLLALPYIGAAKGYLYKPIIELFGATAWSVRIPVIALGALSVVGVYGIARLAYGSLAAVIAAVLLATHPEFIQRTRHDLGPATPDLALQIGCAFLFLRYHSSLRNRDAIAFWLLAALGVWHKITFIWYVNAFVLAALFSGWRALPFSGARVRSHAVAYALLVGWVAWVYFGFSIPQLQASLGSGASQPWGDRLTSFARDMARFGAGVESLAFFHELPPFPGWTWYVCALSAFALAGVIRAACSTNEDAGRARAMIAIVALATLAQVIATRPADKSWHRVSLLALAMLLVADGLTALVKWLGSRVASGRVVPLASVLVCGGALVHHAAVNAYYLRIVCVPATTQRGYSRATQTRATWDLLDAVARSNHRFVFLDWGMRNQAMLLTREPERLFEYRAPDLLGPNADAFADRHLGGDDVFVLHGPDYTCDPSIRDAFFALLAERGVTGRRIAIIHDGPYAAFELWQANNPRSPVAR